jgi:hypothetical protein
MSEVRTTLQGYLGNKKPCAPTSVGPRFLKLRKREQKRFVLDLGFSGRSCLLPPSLSLFLSLSPSLSLSLPPSLLDLQNFVYRTARNQNAFSAVFSTEGRVVGLCWAELESKEPKGFLTKLQPSRTRVLSRYTSEAMWIHQKAPKKQRTTKGLFDSPEVEDQ